MANTKEVVVLLSYATAMQKTKKDIQSTKFLLQKKKVAFREVDAANEGEERDNLRKISGSKNLPQIFIDGKYIGVK